MTKPTKYLIDPRDPEEVEWLKEKLGAKPEEKKIEPSVKQGEWDPNLHGGKDERRNNVTPGAVPPWPIGVESKQHKTYRKQWEVKHGLRIDWTSGWVPSAAGWLKLGRVALAVGLYIFLYLAKLTDNLGAVAVAFVLYLLFLYGPEVR